MADDQEPIDFQAASQEREADEDEYDGPDYAEIARDMAAYILIDDLFEDSDVNISVRRSMADVSPNLWEINVWWEVRKPTDGYMRFVGPTDALYNIALILAASGEVEMPNGWDRLHVLESLSEVTADMLPAFSVALEDVDEDNPVLMLEVYQKGYRDLGPDDVPDILK